MTLTCCLKRLILFVIKQDVEHVYPMRHLRKYVIPKCRTVLRQKCITYTGVKLYNSIIISCVKNNLELPTLYSFKKVVLTLITDNKLDIN